MKFKMNKAGFSLLVSNMALGGAYFATCEDRYHVPNKNREGEDMLEWANLLAKEYQKNSYIELDDDAFVCVMTMVRSCLEACIEYGDDDIVKMLEKHVGIDVPSLNKKGLAKSNIQYCFILLDYLESIAPEGAKIMWEMDKKAVAKERVDNLIERLSNGGVQ
tara:strand:- start:8 stop:493 length:486 start_codon:yes stop_codon:yes gene_type:complete